MWSAARCAGWMSSKARPMLSIANLSVAIQSVQILREVSLQLPTGTMVGLIGRNGAGKTTLMRSIMGLLKVTSGSIAFDSADLVAAPAYARTRLGIGYMPEDRRLIPDLTVEENVLVPAWAAHVADAGARLEKVYGLIPELREFAPRKGLQLSGGQQKLAALGRALMCGTRLLLLDEPFEGVAPALAQRLVEVVADLKREGMSVIVSESDLQHSERMVDRIIVIDRGAIVSKA
jgi:branched-chain amino acid transport system ATP-binding protein